MGEKKVDQEGDGAKRSMRKDRMTLRPMICWNLPQGPHAKVLQFQRQRQEISLDIWPRRVRRKVLGWQQSGKSQISPLV